MYTVQLRYGTAPKRAIYGRRKNMVRAVLVQPFAFFRVGQNHTFIGIFGVYTVFLAGHQYTYGHIRCVRFWPTLAFLKGKRSSRVHLPVRTALFVVSPHFCCVCVLVLLDNAS